MHELLTIREPRYPNLVTSQVYNFSTDWPRCMSSFSSRNVMNAKHEPLSSLSSAAYQLPLIVQADQQRIELQRMRQSEDQRICLLWHAIRAGLTMRTGGGHEALRIMSSAAMLGSRVMFCRSCSCAVPHSHGTLSCLPDATPATHRVAAQHTGGGQHLRSPCCLGTTGTRNQLIASRRRHHIRQTG